MSCITIQYKFNDTFNDIIPDLTQYYEKIKIISPHIKKFITNTLSKKSNIDNEYDYMYSDTQFYAFDNNYGVLLLYHFSVNYSIELEDIYYITKNGMQELTKNKYYSFKTLHESFTLKTKDYTPEDIIDFKGYLYNSNLDILKEYEIYKYSYIWNLKEYSKNNLISLSALTLYPLYYPSYEYLIKMELYNLACTNPYKYTKKSFKENFGIEKNLYPLMKELDITEDELSLLRETPNLTIEEMRFYSYAPILSRELAKYVNLKKLKKYFENQNLTSDNLYEYNDYLLLCKHFKLNIKDSKILFPQDFFREHNRLSNEYQITKNKKANSKLEALSKILNINYYEDDNYIIYPASNIASLINESEQMHNCVRTYTTYYSENALQIYFLRSKKEKDKSLVTIEIKDNKINQARMKYNEPVTAEINTVLKKWESNLIPIYND